MTACLSWWLVEVIFWRIDKAACLSLVFLQRRQIGDTALKHGAILPLHRYVTSFQTKGNLKRFMLPCFAVLNDYDLVRYKGLHALATQTSTITNIARTQVDIPEVLVLLHVLVTSFRTKCERSSTVHSSNVHKQMNSCGHNFTSSSWHQDALHALHGPQPHIHHRHGKPHPFWLKQTYERHCHPWTQKCLT